MHFTFVIKFLVFDYFELIFGVQKIDLSKKMILRYFFPPNSPVGVGFAAQRSHSALGLPDVCAD